MFGDLPFPYRAVKERATALLLWLCASVQMDAKLGWAPRPGEEEEEGSLHSQHGTEASLRSSQSLKSKQSFRSLKSGGRGSTGDRSGNGQGRCAYV